MKVGPDLVTVSAYPKSASCLVLFLTTRDTPMLSGKTKCLRRKCRSAARMVQRTIHRRADSTAFEAKSASRRIALARSSRGVTRLAMAAAILLLSLAAAALYVGAPGSLRPHSRCNQCHAGDEQKDRPVFR